MEKQYIQQYQYLLMNIKSIDSGKLTIDDSQWGENDEMRFKLIGEGSRLYLLCFVLQIVTKI